MDSEYILATKAYYMVCRQKHLDELYSIEERAKLQKFCDILSSEKIQKQLNKSEDSLKIEISL